MRPGIPHAPGVQRVGGRYPYLPVCGCGWKHTVGYVAEHAAQSMADDHAAKAPRTVLAGIIRREYDISEAQDITRVTVIAGDVFAGGNVRDDSPFSVGELLTESFTSIDRALREQEAGIR